MPNGTYEKLGRGEDDPTTKKRPVTEYRAGKGKMDDDELQGILQAVIGDAEDFVDEELSPVREKATKYYNAEPFGNEEEGRSQFVVSEVRDAVTGIMPSLMRVFVGPDDVVEFVPKSKESVSTARLMTDAVRNKFELQGGFLKLYAALLDGLVRDIGAFMWGWEERDTITEETLSGLTMGEINALAEEEGVEIVEKEEDGTLTPEVPAGPEAQAMAGQMTPMPGQGPQPGMMGPPPEEKTYKVRVKRTVTDGDTWYDAVPTEELIFSRTTRTPTDTLFIGRRKKVTRGELLAMGYEEEDIEEHLSLGKLGESLEVDSRNPSENEGDADSTEENEEAVYFEGYLRLDYEGEGADVYKICALGAEYKPLHIERADEIKLAVWSPYPEPHTLVGKGVASRTMDLQLLKSALLRGILDSLSASIFPRMAYIEGQVNPEDVLNTEIGGPYRVKNTSSLANALMPITIPFQGREGLTLMEYADGIRESRIGRSAGPDGLDQDALQSTEKAAARAAVSASQMSTEMIARMAAEQLLKPLFRGLMRELARHKPKPYMTKVRSQWMEVDPRSWMSDLDVQCNIALGSGTVEMKLGNLDKIISRLTALMGTGPDNPIASWVELRNALAAEAEILGYKDTEKFYKMVTPEQLRQMQAAAAMQPPPPSPEQMLAEGQIEAKRLEVEGKLAIERDKLHLEERRMLMEDDRERDKNEATAILKRMEIEAVNQVQLSQQEINAVMQRDRSELDREKLDIQRDQLAADKDVNEVEMAARVHEATTPPELPAGAEGGE